MGQVYLARRADNLYEQEVAIKLMHAGLKQAQSMLSRFSAERQILANLNHPNIARLLDAGHHSRRRSLPGHGVHRRHSYRRILPGQQAVAEG